MKTNLHNHLRRALAVLVLAGMFAVSARAGVYQMKSNYLAGTVAPYSAGGGVPAQPYITSQTITSTNATLRSYGMMGWYSVQSSPDLVTWTQVGSTVAATDFPWTFTVTNALGLSGNFRLAVNNSYAGQGACSGCHGDKYTDYLTTKHSAAYSSPSASTNFALVCRTVGYGQPTGFVDATTTPNLENVGCENCHGPAGWHKNSDHSLILPAVSIDPSICGSCHQGSLHPTFKEYTNLNATALANAPVGVVQVNVGHYVGGHNSFGCAFCHNAVNRENMLDEYEDHLAGNPHPVSLDSAAPAWTATCATCHDPHVSNYAAQLRYPTFSTNYFAMPTTTDVRTVLTTNFQGAVTTNSVNVNTVFDALYNPKVQVCGQCHGGGRGARWDGTSYNLVTNSIVSGPVTNTVFVNIYTTNVTTQVFTNSLGQPYLTNTYTSVYISGRYATNLVTLSQTNPVVGVGVYAPLIAYTNVVIGVSTNIAYTTNSSGFSAPHYPVQYNVLIGQLDYDYASAAGVPNVLNDPHTLAPNQCVDCHVPKYAVNAGTNVTGHSFASDNIGCLASCHSSLTPAQLVAKTASLKLTVTNGLVRVVSLLNQWGTNIAPAILRTNYAQLAWEFTSPGVFGTKSTNNGVKFLVGPPKTYNPTFGTVPSGTNDNLQLSTVPQDIRIARWSLYMIYYDQSLGVHNPTYVKALLADAENRVMNQFVTSNYPAAFSASVTSGTHSLTVTFNNYNLTGSVYNWTFGDGGTATGANPAYTYNTPGIYSVTCTVDGTPLTRTRYISVQ